jgi:basic membrane protein A
MNGAMGLKSLWMNLGLAIASFALAVGCGASVPDTATPPDTPGRLRVAMITTGAADDGSWSQAGIEGLKRIESEFNAEVDFTAEVADPDGETYLRQYAEAGYDFIIGHSGGYIDGAEVVSAEFPRTKFALVTTYPGNNRNLGAVAFRSGEAGYLAGVLAAMTTQTNKVAYLVGYDYPVYQEEAALFRKGALATNPDVEVVTEFLQTWTDGEKGKTVALALAEQGFDRFAINADEAGIEALKAVTQADPAIQVVGWTTDQHDLAPGQVITSMLQDIPELIVNAADLFQQGKWEGKLYKFGLKEGIYSVAPFRDALTPEQEAAFDAIKNQVMIGEIDISPV